MQDALTLNDIAARQNRSRVLLMFSPSEVSGEAARQEEYLASDLQAVAARDLELICVAHDAAADAVRRHYDVAEGSFTVVLLGKDGKVKHRAAHAIPLSRLCQIIDAMPLRQAESQS